MKTSITPFAGVHVLWLESFRAMPSARYRAANDPQMLVRLEWDDEEEPGPGPGRRPAPALLVQ